MVDGSYGQQEAYEGFLDPSCNVLSLGFLKEIFSGDGTVNS